MSTPAPPPDFQSWLDYAVATLNTRCDISPSQDQDDVRASAQEELDHLKAMAYLPGYRILQNWRGALSKRLGRSAEAIIEDSLGPADFSEDSVRVQFGDGTDLTFRRAFYVGETPADGAIHRVAVFTEHCGYHEFWIGPDDRIEAVSFQEKIYHGLTEEEAKNFASDLVRWIKQSSVLYSGLQLEEDEVSDARNVQLALHELGQDVSLDVAAAVWKHYSQSVMASLMAGAETVAGAAKTL